MAVQHEPYNYFDPRLPTAHLSGGNLPHWRQDSVIYFVTFRLADSLPSEFWERWTRERNTWLSTHPEPHDKTSRVEYTEKFARPLAHRLDAGHGSCVLMIPDVQRVMHTTLNARAGVDYRLDAHVIAPNHVHALVAVKFDRCLSDIVRAWKSVSAHAIMKTPEALERLAQHQPGRARPAVWQKESFDHIVRSPEHLDKFRAYIRAHRSCDS